jgi:hypothetical protein
MAFDINQFRSGIALDGARPNLFEVQLGFPTIGGINIVNGALAGAKSNLLVKASQLPGSSLGTVSLNYFGRELKFAGNRTFTDWTVTVINDEDFLIRAALESWMNSINSHVGNVRVGGNTPLGYTSQGTVTQYGKLGKDDIIKKIQIIGMFPIDLSPIELDWGSNDSIEEYSITFAYQYWTDDTTSTVTGNPSTTS